MKKTGIKKVKGPFGGKRGLYFPGKPNAYLVFGNKNNNLHFRSFTMFTWIRQRNGIRNGPILEYKGYSRRGQGTHFWIWRNTLYINLVHNHRKSYAVAFPKFKGMLPKNKWNFVGVSYDSKKRTLLMWINGRTYVRRTPGAFIPDTVGKLYMGTRPSNKRFHPFKGYLSGVSILPYAVSPKGLPRFLIHINAKLGREILHCELICRNVLALSKCFLLY